MESFGSEALRSRILALSENRQHNQHGKNHGIRRESRSIQDHPLQHI
jgi:hypothetical protein